MPRLLLKGKVGFRVQTTTRVRFRWNRERKSKHILPNSAVSSPHPRALMIGIKAKPDSGRALLGVTVPQSAVKHLPTDETTRQCHCWRTTSSLRWLQLIRATWQWGWSTEVTLIEDLRHHSITDRPIQQRTRAHTRTHCLSGRSGTVDSL